MPEADFQTGQQPTRMHFLPEKMRHSNISSNAVNGDTLPPFAESVVLASLCGHSVVHRRLIQFSTLYSCTPESQVFWTRHRWLAAAMRARINGHTRSVSAAAVRGVASPAHDPMWPFNRILAYSTSVSLSSMAEANPWQTLEDSVIASTYTKLAYLDATEAVFFLRSLPRWAFTKVCRHLPSQDQFHPSNSIYYPIGVHC